MAGFPLEPLVERRLRKGTRSGAGTLLTFKQCLIANFQASTILSYPSLNPTQERVMRKRRAYHHQPNRSSRPTSIRWAHHSQTPKICRLVRHSYRHAQTILTSLRRPALTEKPMVSQSPVTIIISKLMASSAPSSMVSTTADRAIAAHIVPPTDSILTGQTFGANAHALAMSVTCSMGPMKTISMPQHLHQRAQTQSKNTCERWD